MTKDMIRRSNRFPTILDSFFSDSIFDDYEKTFDKFFGTSQVVPYDAIQHKDDKGNVVDTELRYALAGYDKDNIAIEIDDDLLTCTVDKTEEVEDKGEEYLHKGISQRRIQFSYRLNGYDKENIISSFENGVLSIKLPVTEKKAIKKIEVKASLPTKETKQLKSENK